MVVPVKASANRSSENLAIKITQFWRSHNKAIVVDIGELGNEDGLLAANCAGIAPPSSTCLFALNKN